MIERATPEKVSTELIIRMSILLDHLPTNFDVAFKRALETLDVGPESEPRLNNTHAGPGEQAKDNLFESAAEIGLKGTTDRSGGEGNVVNDER